MSKTTKIGIGVVVLAVIGIVVGILLTRPKGDFTMPATLNLAVPISKTGTLEITLTPPQGQSLPKGDITFSVKGTPPTGVKISFNPSKLTLKGDEKSAKAIIVAEVGTAAKTGKYTLTVVASGAGKTKESTLTLTVQEAPDYSLEVSPATVTVRQGATATVTVNVKRNETMKDPVDIVVEGAPAGMKVTVDPAKVPADKASATLRIEVPATLEAKDYTLTIRGKAPGIADKTASLKVTVQSVDFSLKAEPSVVTIQPGASVAVTISIIRTNLAEAVTFVAKDVPAGISVTFAPPSTTGNETKVTISAAADAAPGSYKFTVEGTAAGKTKTVTISVNVGG